jgi:glycosyltransferase involved in cell wall biosynthesis
MARRPTRQSGTSPIKVAIFDAYPVTVGGAHTVAREIARAGSAAGQWQTSVVLGQDGAVASWLRDQGVDVRVVASPSGLLHFGGGWRRHLLGMAAGLPALWWRLRPVFAEVDVVHLHDFRGVVFGAPGALLARRPFVVHIHNAENGGRAWRLFAALLLRSRVPVLVPSKRGASVWAGRRADALHEVPNPVAPGDGGPESEHPNVVCVARIDRDKGIADLIDAIDRLSPVHPDLRLVVAGGVSPGQAALAAELEERVRRSGRVALVGEVADVSTVLSGAWVYAQPSLREPFGLAALEASAFGLPVVASAVGGLRDVVVDGETGRLVPPGDVDALGAAIDDLLRAPDERRRLGDNGRRRAADRFSPAEFGQRLAEIYRDRVRR